MKSLAESWLNARWQLHFLSLHPPTLLAELSGAGAPNSSGFVHEMFGTEEKRGDQHGRDHPRRIGKKQHAWKMKMKQQQDLG